MAGGSDEAAADPIEVTKAARKQLPQRQTRVSDRRAARGCRSAAAALSHTHLPSLDVAQVSITHVQLRKHITYHQALACNVAGAPILRTSLTLPRRWRAWPSTTRRVRVVVCGVTCLRSAA